MAGNTNLVEDTMQLGDNIVDLGGQITRVDRHCKYDTKKTKLIKDS